MQKSEWESGMYGFVLIEHPNISNVVRFSIENGRKSGHPPFLDKAV
jgi:hypothetical protein